MYDEYDNKDTGRVNPEEHKEEAVTTNFIMRDPDPEKPSSQDSESGNQIQDRSSYSAQQSIPHYQEYQYHRAAEQNVYQEEGKPRKKGSFAKKAAGIVGGALVFGVVAGSTMVFIGIIVLLASLDLLIKGAIEDQEETGFPKELEGSGGKIMLHKNHNAGFSFGCFKDHQPLVQMIPLAVASFIGGMLACQPVNIRSR